MKWRSIRGRVPRPIEPKPIITMGPLMRPWTGQSVMALKVSGMMVCGEPRLRGKRPQAGRFD
ncbi:hypothetical protein mvi_50870 [Methylobacterium indicum]|uniref:Uncharacterized protein n=1 Tax=Methylobacterium indicum TaxID=1775910 RepID=A0A8H9C9D1_9HYPH|nr:hypothetical protein mvi_50870 [Methylobacterium indicum]